MNLLTPLALGLLALAGPIILLYMLRLRRREVPISSTMLWQRLMQDREANTPWQKLRRNLLLILQLIILALLALALARPFIPVPSVAAGSVALLIDASASMNATDGTDGTARFDVALDEARQIVRELGPDEVMTVITVGATPQVLTPPISDKAALRDALSRAQTTQAAADWDAALALAGASIAGRENARIVVISDGGLPADLPTLPTEVAYIQVGQAAENVAITALATRPLVDVPQLFISLTNFGTQDAEVILSLEVNGDLYTADRVTVSAGQTLDQTITDLPEDTRRIRAELSQPNEGATPDYLALDDVAYATYQPPTGGDVLLVTEGNLFLEQILTAFPGVNAFRARPGDLPESEFDLIVFDGETPTELPNTNLLILGPERDTNLYSIEGEFENTRFSRQQEDPILAFVDFADVAIREGMAVTTTGWAQTLAEAEGGPLLLTGEVGGRRVAILTFDLLASDFPLKVGFPILLANLLEWYAPSQVFDAPESLQPGDLVTVRPGPTTTEFRVVQPDGSIRREEIDAEVSLAYTATTQLGIYSIELYDGSELVNSGDFAINLFAADESDITPAGSITFGQTEVQDINQSEQELGQRELWPILAVLGLIVLVVEWYVYHRGSTLPRLGREEALP